ncbi:MAG: hypothetical protein AAGA03_16120 [Planctomycetota bacterium]
MQRFQTYRILGALVWFVTAALTLSWAASSGPGDRQAGSPSNSLVAFLTQRPETIRLIDSEGKVRVGDPAFLPDEHEGWIQAGHVVDVSPGELGQNQIVVHWYRGEVSTTDCSWTLYQNRGRFEDVAAVMLPEAKRRQIQERLRVALTRHGKEMSAALVPIVERSVKESLPLVEQEFRLAVQRHRDELDRLTDRLRSEVVDARLVPLAKDAILPIVRKHAGPPMEEIGLELWERASVWSFAWRAVYDKSPLPERNLVKREWDRFVESEAIPVIESRVDEITRAVERSVQETLQNEKVRREIGDVVDVMASDQEVRQLLQVILKETLVDNRALRQHWTHVWTSPEAKSAIELATRRMEPVIRSIGDDLFGTPEKGIDPAFASVLRNQILRKDQRWIIARPLPSGNEEQATMRIRPAQDRMRYPIVYSLADSTPQPTDTGAAGVVAE